MVAWIIVGDNVVAHTAPVEVNVGDVIEGIVEMGGGDDFTVEWIDTSNGTSAYVSANLWNYPGVSFEYADTGVLEEYGVTSCSQYPDGANGSTAFIAVQMQDECDNPWTPPVPAWWWCRNTVGTDPSKWSSIAQPLGGACNQSVSNFTFFGNTALLYY